VKITSAFLLVPALLMPFLQPAEVICTLGPATSSYNAYSDQRPTGDAMQLAGRVNTALVGYCRPNCPTVALFRNPSAPNAMVIKAGGQTKIVYKPEFLTSVYDTAGDGGILAILAHQVGHAIDAGARPAWMKSDWTPELRADAWAGCAFAKMNLSKNAVRSAVKTLENHPSASNANWTMRLSALRLGYAQCGGDAGKNTGESGIF
jgi:hypothetical protein